MDVLIPFCGAMLVACSIVTLICIHVLNLRHAPLPPTREWVGWRKCGNCRGMYATMSSNVEGFCSDGCRKEWQDIQALERLIKM